MGWPNSSIKKIALPHRCGFRRSACHAQFVSVSSLAQKPRTLGCRSPARRGSGNQEGSRAYNATLTSGPSRVIRRGTALVHYVFSLTNGEHVNPPCRRSCQVPPDMSVAQQTIYTPSSLDIPPFPLHCNVDSRGQLERCLRHFDTVEERD